MRGRYRTERLPVGPNPPAAPVISRSARGHADPVALQRRAEFRECLGGGHDGRSVEQFTPRPPAVGPRRSAPTATTSDRRDSVGGQPIPFSPGGLVARTGFRALSVNYRLSPEHPFPAAIEDTLRAYRALLDGGEDPAAIAFAGDSAGGGLDDSTRLAARARAAGVDVILDITADVAHVFQCLAGVLDEADEALDRAALFLTQRIRARDLSGSSIRG
ncbi:alpha/beta hydrolase fold domain-containing protein [Nocardia terpenica]|uniref:alpha/beta hydrolase fold domain-containing protein n=1 Tax=Nocardia terpenica TaxID=455432 RepID=UPI0022B23AB3|nr:alpha/beta hydrolase fold domain-containing protein [Nocardia terpenica]